MAAPFPEDTHAGEVGGAGGKWGKQRAQGEGHRGVGANGNSPVTGFEVSEVRLGGGSGGHGIGGEPGVEARKRNDFSQHQRRKKCPEETHGASASSHIWLLLILQITAEMSPPQRGLPMASRSVLCCFHHNTLFICFLTK